MSDERELQQDSVAAVREFFAAMEIKDLEAVLDLVDPDIVWRNTSLPDVRGSDRLRTVLRLLDNRRFGFRADMHHIAAESNGSPAAEGSTVLTERTDYLRLGPLEIAFWVCGTFELVDGRITLWHDHFSWENFLRGTVTGVWRALRGR